MVMACSHDLQLLQSLQGVVLQFLKSRKLAGADKGPERMITYEQDPVSWSHTPPVHKTTCKGPQSGGLYLENLQLEINLNNQALIWIMIQSNNSPDHHTDSSSWRLTGLKSVSSMRPDGDLDN